MANSDLKINIYPNTLIENQNILRKLRTRKVDNKSTSEWKKLFTKINNSTNIKESKGLKFHKSEVTSQNNVADKPIYGPIPDFTPGSWWGIRMDCSRDGVHTPFDRDIEEGSFGVTSICTSHVNTKNDADLGLLLTFTGGEYFPKTTMKLDDPLLANLKNYVPVRLVRSYNLANDFAPNAGYRYDGLYIVASFWIGVSTDSKHYYKYALTKIDYQEQTTTSIPTRVSTRLLSSVKKSTPKSLCGSIRCHMDCCQEQKSKKIEKKIDMERTQSTNLIKSNQNNVNFNSTDSHKNATESTIVMRCVSKKYEPASPIQPVNSSTCSPNSPSFDLQNMNISIRTELYDSSPNPYDNSKKSATLYKLHRVNKVMEQNTCSSPDPINLNLFSPDNHNLSQESQIQLRKSIPKMLNSPDFKDQTLKNNNNNNNNLNNKNQSNMNTKNVENKFFKDLSNNSPAINNSNYLTNESNGKTATNENNKLKSSRLTSKTKILKTSLPIDESVKEKSNLPEAFIELESMSPEQMLNLIMKKRFNPTGKLLMGSIIGLPSDDSCIVNVNGSLKLIEKKNYDNKTRLNPSTSHAFKLSHEEMKKNVLPKDNIKSNSSKLYESRSKTISSIKLEHYKNKNGRIKKTDSLSKSSMIKKRRDELAKLKINANFMTNFRGQSVQTRTMSSRRLRCPKILLNKKKEFPGFVTNFSRIDLAKKSRSKITKNNNVLTKMKNLKNNKVNDKKSDAKTHNKINLTTNSNNNNNDKSDSKIGRKKLNLQQNKLFDKSNKKEKAVGNSNLKKVDASTQCRLTKDASTSANIEKAWSYQNDSCVKVEWIDVNNIKSELNVNSNESLATIFYRDNEVQTSDEVEYSDTNIINKEMYETTYIRNESPYIKWNNSNDTVSAFVPVNLSDRDLRVVRLRSIGFKPIQPYEITNNSCYTNYYANTSVKRVLSREVHEQYDKYTSDETSTVGYMDNELHYQDIEGEDFEEDNEDVEDEEDEEMDEEESEEEEEEEEEDEDNVAEGNYQNFEIEVEIENSKEKNLAQNLSNEMLIYKNEYMKKRKRSISSINNDDQIQGEGKNEFSWPGWNKLIKTKR